MSRGEKNISKFQIKIEIEGRELWDLEEKAKSWGLSVSEYARILVIKNAVQRRSHHRTGNQPKERLEIDYYEYLNLKNNFYWSQESIAKKFGMSPDTLRRRVNEYEQGPKK